MVRRATAVLLLLAACTSSPEAAVTTATIGRTTTPTAAPPATTTMPAPPATTTTTIPRLDRSEAATLERLHADLDVLLAMGPRVSGSAAEEAAARHFADAATAITGEPARIETLPLPNGGTSRNVWSSEVGGGDRLLVIGSHLDSVVGSPGADDNGSGAIVILELLRRLTEDPPHDLRVVVVGFGAEENIVGLGHHHGSRFAVARLQDQHALPDLMISVDMVGFGPTLVCGSLRDHDPSFADEIQGVVAAGAEIEIERRVRGEISDHAAFAQAGVPAAHLWRDGNPDYHRPGDDHVDDAALLEDLTLLDAIIAHLAPPPLPPPPGAGAHQT